MGNSEEKELTNEITNAKDTDSSLKCFYTNAGSLESKFEEFKVRISSCDIVAVTETWFNDEITDAEVAVAGFNMYRKDRKGRRGGGVVIYIKSCLASVLETSLTDSAFEDSIWCTLNLLNKRLLVGVC